MIKGIILEEKVQSTKFENFYFVSCMFKRTTLQKNSPIDLTMILHLLKWKRKLPRTVGFEGLQRKGILLSQ